MRIVRPPDARPGEHAAGLVRVFETLIGARATGGARA